MYLVDRLCQYLEKTFGNCATVEQLASTFNWNNEDTQRWVTFTKFLVAYNEVFYIDTESMVTIIQVA